MAKDRSGTISEIRRAYGLAADQVLQVEAGAHQNDPENVEKRIDAIQRNFDAVRELIKQVVADTNKAPELLKQLGGLTSIAGYPLSREGMWDVLRYAKELCSRYATLQFFYDLGVLNDLVD
ncbi:MAG: hypothetical protein ACOX60_04415 [Massiliimalia sp.]